MSVRYAVIGAGNGGIAMAGFLALKGFEVNLYNRTKERIEPLMRDPRIELTGWIEGTGMLSMVTDDIKEAIQDTEIIMVTVPATGHYHLAKMMAPYLKKPANHSAQSGTHRRSFGGVWSFKEIRM